MTIIATGIDLAKNVFAVHGVNGGGVVQVRQPKVQCTELKPPPPGKPDADEAWIGWGHAAHCARG